MTSEVQQSKAKNIAAEVSKLPGVENAQVDDWSDYGLFSIIITLCSEDSKCTFKISLLGFLAKVKQIIKSNGGCLDGYDAPKRVYAYAGSHARKYFDGYDTNTYRLNVRIP